MEYISKDFENLMLNAYDVPIGNSLFNAFPILNKYDEFKVKVEGIQKEKVLRYVIFAFDRNSPLVGINDILERRVEAALLSGFKLTKRKFKPEVDKMIRSLLPEVNHMIIRYCMFLGDTDYSVLITYEDSLLKELQALMDFDNAKSVNDDERKEKKGEILRNIDSLRLNIKKLKEEFLARNVDYFLTRSLHEFSESQKFELSPEFYANELKGWDNVSKYYDE